MRMKWDKMPEWMCMSPSVVKKLGTVFAVVGGILIIVFVPIEYWMALLGLILLLAGLAIRICL